MFLLLAASCGDDPRTVSIELSVRAFLSGPLAEAAVRLSHVDLDAQELVPVEQPGCSSTDAAGGCTLKLVGPAGPYVVEVLHGVYNRWAGDEAWGSRGELAALFHGGRTTEELIISPLTTQAVARLRYDLARGAADGDENQQVARLVGFDPTQVEPLTVAERQPVTEGAVHGLLLAGLDARAELLGTSIDCVVDAMTDDVVHDGILDGMGSEGAHRFSVEYGPVEPSWQETGPDWAKLHLVMALRIFLNDLPFTRVYGGWLSPTGNATGISVHQLLPYLNDVGRVENAVYGASPPVGCDAPELSLHLPKDGSTCARDEEGRLKYELELDSAGALVAEYNITTSSQSLYVGGQSYYGGKRTISGTSLWEEEGPVELTVTAVNDCGAAARPVQVSCK
jgi:hypothetical protein